MRIVIATGIYPPEIGGPAAYAKGVHEALTARGFDAPVVLFSGLRKYPTGLRHVLYAIALLRAARHAHAIIAFDTGSAGIPAALVARVLRIPLIIRIGGDFVWEMYMNRTQDRVPLPLFYAAHKSLNLKERLAFALVRWMLKHAELAFNTQWLADIWMQPYRLSRERVHVVGNVIGERLPSTGDEPVMLLYGRDTAIKNTAAFRRAFERARTEGVSLRLEEGRVPREEFLERIRLGQSVAVPSVSEVAPNSVIDAIRCGKPFLLSKYSGYAERFAQYGVIVDPLDEDSMVRGIKELADPAIYARLRSRIAEFKEMRTYDDVTREFLAILKL